MLRRLLIRRSYSSCINSLSTEITLYAQGQLFTERIEPVGTVARIACAAMVFDFVARRVDGAAKKRTGGVACSEASLQLVVACCSVAIPASVFTGVRPAYINTIDAMTFFSLGFVFPQFFVTGLETRELAACELLENTGVYAASVFYSESIEIDCFRACVDCHPVFASDICNTLSEIILLNDVYAVGAHRIVNAFGAKYVLVDEAYGDVGGESFEFVRDGSESAQLVVERIFAVEEYRVESPIYPAWTDNARQLLKYFYEPMLVG